MPYSSFVYNVLLFLLWLIFRLPDITLLHVRNDTYRYQGDRKSACFTIMVGFYWYKFEVKGNDRFFQGSSDAFLKRCSTKSKWSNSYCSVIFQPQSPSLDTHISPGFIISVTPVFTPNMCLHDLPLINPNQIRNNGICSYHHYTKIDCGSLTQHKNQL